MSEAEQCQGFSRYIPLWVYRLMILLIVQRIEWTSRKLIRWVVDSPNDHNLGNLIQFRHRLRMGLYDVENGEFFENLGKKDCWELRTVERAMLNNVARLEEAIIWTEEVLEGS